MLQTEQRLSRRMLHHAPPVTYLLVNHFSPHMWEGIGGKSDFGFQHALQTAVSWNRCVLTDVVSTTPAPPSCGLLWPGAINQVSQGYCKQQPAPPARNPSLRFKRMGCLDGHVCITFGQGNRDKFPQISRMKDIVTVALSSSILFQ